MSASNVKATDHESRPETREFDIESRSTNDECRINDEWRKKGRFIILSNFVIKKVPPPTPDGREGRLFPPEQSAKLRW
jgi:hypothetical protein